MRGGRRRLSFKRKLRKIIRKLKVRRGGYH